MRANDVRPDDIVVIDAEDGPLTVNELAGSAVKPWVHLVSKDERRVCARSRIIGLVHHPWPEGKTASDMLEDVDKAIFAYWLGLEKPEAGREAILGALVAYFLGKPVEPAPKGEGADSGPFCPEHDGIL